MFVNVEKELFDFKNKVQKNARRNIKKKSSSRSLQLSVKGSVKKTKKGFEVPFEMLEYGMYVDQGVKGKGGKKADGTSWKLKKVTTKSFRYKKKKPPIKVFDKWIVKSGGKMVPRNEKKQFTSRRSLKFALQKHVFHTGLKTTLFFTRPFERQLKILQKNLYDAFGKDILKLL